MATEIERKFLVTGDDWRDADSTYICQGYLNRDKHRTVRIRVAGSRAYLTIKGISEGASRAEYEYPVPLDDAAKLLEICDGPIVEKNRFILEHGGMTWEIDEFLGENRGLVVAEIELESEEQKFDQPTWIGKEVTDDARYFNSRLSTHPFSRWKNEIGT